jgi:hypothetical protein
MSPTRQDARVYFVVGDSAPYGIYVPVNVNHRNGEVDHSGYKVMREVALMRMEEDLITEGAMAEAIESSAGILTELVRLIRDAANIANMGNRGRIEEGDVKRVVTW